MRKKYLKKIAFFGQERARQTEINSIKKGFDNPMLRKTIVESYFLGEKYKTMPELLKYFQENADATTYIVLKKLFQGILTKSVFVNLTDELGKNRLFREDTDVIVKQPDLKEFMSRDKNGESYIDITKMMDESDWLWMFQKGIIKKEEVPEIIQEAGQGFDAITWHYLFLNEMVPWDMDLEPYVKKFWEETWRLIAEKKPELIKKYADHIDRFTWSALAMDNLIPEDMTEHTSYFGYETWTGNEEENQQ